MLKSDRWIREQADNGMIQPFVPYLVRKVLPYDKNPGLYQEWTRRVLSFGCSSYGYDLRLSPVEFKIFRRIPGTVINPKRFSDDNLEIVPLQSDEDGHFFILPAHTYGLGVSLERIEIPENITCLFIGKSSYARCGVIANLTPGEAGWKGHLTLELSNSSNSDCRIYAYEGIAQALFLEGGPCETTYEDRQGKYQNQPQSVVTACV